jgi:hypothetical protein
MLGFRSVSPELLAIRVARLLAILSVWSVVVALAMGYFFSPRGVEVQPAYYDLIGFGCAFAIAGTVATSVALALGGKRKWAVELALAVVLAISVAVVLAALALWVAPMTVRSRMDTWSFLRLREDVLRWGEFILGFYAPLGVGLGSVVGGIAGLLTVLARRRPRLATGISLGLLVACASGPVRTILFGLVILWGRLILWWEWLIHRFIHIPFSTWPMTPDEVWATAAILGAIAGAFIAFLLTHVARWHRSGPVPRTEGDRGPAMTLSPWSREERDRTPSEGSATRADSRTAPD